MSEWISVRDRLPENDNYVLATVKCYDLPVIAWHGKIRGWRILDYDCSYGETDWHIADDYSATVTHWMPLPELPKEYK